MSFIYASTSERYLFLHIGRADCGPMLMTIMVQTPVGWTYSTSWKYIYVKKKISHDLRVQLDACNSLMDLSWQSELCQGNGETRKIVGGGWITDVHSFNTIRIIFLAMVPFGSMFCAWYVSCRQGRCEQQCNCHTFFWHHLDPPRTLLHAQCWHSCEELVNSVLQMLQCRLFGAAGPRHIEVLNVSLVPVGYLLGCAFHKDAYDNFWYSCRNFWYPGWSCHLNIARFSPNVFR